MHKRAKYGSSIIEYIIPIALIAIVVGLSLFYIFSNDNLGGFLKSSMGVHGDGDKVVLDKNIEALPLVSNTDKSSSLQPGSLGGTDNDPEIKCNDKECSIDYGSFSLSGVPSNFNDFVESSATSGGTDKISDLLMQIALQLEREGKIEEANKVKRLANIGHNIGAVQRSFENMAIGCINAGNCQDQYPYALQEEMMFSKPADFDDAYGRFPDQITIYDAKYAGCFGATRSDMTSDEDYYSGTMFEINKEFVTLLDSVTENNTIASEMRGVIKELAWDMGVIAEDFQNNFSYIMGSGHQGYYDPETGERSETPPPGGSSKLSSETKKERENAFINYEASKITDFDSSLICAAGRYTDEGRKCH